MREILEDIRLKLEKGFYKNEEHIRLSLVSRMLFELGWNIWDPRQVYTEFCTIKNEDSTRVDMALFLRPDISNPTPAFFIEVKNIGRIEKDLRKTEEQLRDYNKNNTALFTLLTDGRRWRFYYSLTGGEFSDKCYKELDIASDDFGDLENSFRLFLSKESVEKETAKNEAERYISLNKKQRIMADKLPLAEKKVFENPLIGRAQALVDVVMEESEYEITLEEAVGFLRKIANENNKTSISKQPIQPHKPFIENVIDRNIDADSPILHIKFKRSGRHATGKFVGNGEEFMVFRGSLINPKVGTITERQKEIREKLIKDKILIEQNGNVIFEKDYIFQSPAEAANIIAGCSTDCLIYWKTENGVLLKELKQKGLV